MIAAHLHHDYAGFEFSFGRAFEKLINFFLNLLTDLLLSTFLAYRAGDILDFNEVGLHCRSAQISPRADCGHFPGTGFNASTWIRCHRARKSVASAFAAGFD
jgi:hypothetical protein